MRITESKYASKLKIIISSIIHFMILSNVPQFNYAIL